MRGLSAALLGLVLLLSTPCSSAAPPTISLSAGFTSDAVLQRSAVTGAKLYGFVASGTAPVTVTVSSSDGAAAPYKVHATAAPWVNTTGGCMPMQLPNGTMAGCTDPKTPAMPEHGLFTWVAQLKPQPKAGGSSTITVSTPGINGTLTLERVTYGDVYFCSGQSNMALETYYTFSADSLKAEIASGKYAQLRHFMYGSMSNHFEALDPQWVTTWNTPDAPLQCEEGVCDEGFVWHNVTHSASLPSSKPAGPNDRMHSAFAQFSSTCMFFGAELIDARAAEGLEDVPIGLIQSAIGGSQVPHISHTPLMRDSGSRTRLSDSIISHVSHIPLNSEFSSQIEAWMDNETLSLCKNQSLVGGAVPEDRGRLYYGMTAPFVNYSVAGWIWYQVISRSVRRGCF